VEPLPDGPGPRIAYVLAERLGTDEALEPAKFRQSASIVALMACRRAERLLPFTGDLLAARVWKVIEANSDPQPYRVA
jgi:hypothetical protein